MAWIYLLEINQAFQTIGINVLQFTVSFSSDGKKSQNNRQTDGQISTMVL